MPSSVSSSCSSMCSTGAKRPQPVAAAAFLPGKPVLFRQPPQPLPAEALDGILAMPAPRETPGMTRVLKVEGMMCEHCEATVKKALEAIPGVVSATASHEKGEALVQADREIDEAALRKAVEDQMYAFKSVCVVR